MQLLAVGHGLFESRVRLGIGDELRDVRHEDARQALHMQQPRPRHEHAPPDLPTGRVDGAPQLLQLLAPLSQLLPVQPALQPVQVHRDVCKLYLGCCWDL